MKEKIKEYMKILVIMLVFTFIISIPYLNFNSIFTHDISYHTNRIVCIAEELKLGNFPVLIHSSLLDGFGYANSLFYPELFLYIPAILINIGLNFLTSYKIFTMLTTFFTIFITYISAKRIFEKKSITWTITLLYSTAFYRLTDIYTRGALGEVLALTFLPLIIAGLYEIIFGKNEKWWLICFGIFGVINSHVLSFAMTIILIICVCLLNIVRILKDKKRLLNLIIAGVLSILLTFSFVLPYFEQESNDKYNVDEKIYGGDFLENYCVSLRELINNQVKEGNFYKCVGTVLLILPFLILACKEKDDKKTYMNQLFGIGLVVLFMTTSLFPWIKICSVFKDITTMQFPYRLNIILNVIFSFVGGYALNKVCNEKENFSFVIYIILIFVSMNLLSNIDINSKKITVDEILSYAPVGNGEYKPYAMLQIDDKVHNINSEESIPFEKVGSKIEFYYNDLENEMEIHVPLTYYKGYKAYIEENGEKKKLIVSEDEATKNIKISNKEKLSGKITVEYKMTTIQKISYIITGLTFIGIVYYIIYKKVKNK